MQELPEAAPGVTRCREVRELLVEGHEAGAIQLQRLGRGQPAVEGLIVLHRAPLGEEDLHFFNQVFFRRRELPGVFQQRRGRDEPADGAMGI